MAPEAPSGIRPPVAAAPRGMPGEQIAGRKPRSDLPQQVASSVALASCAGAHSRCKRYCHTPTRLASGCPGSPATCTGLPARVGWRVPLRSTCVCDSLVVLLGGTWTGRRSGRGWLYLCAFPWIVRPACGAPCRLSAPAGPLRLVPNIDALTTSEDIDGAGDPILAARPARRHRLDIEPRTPIGDVYRRKGPQNAALSRSR